MTTVEEKQELVGKIAKRLASIELKLHAARHDFEKLEPLLKTGRKYDMVDGTKCMLMVSEASAIAGSIGAIEQRVYNFHDRLTAIAADKKNESDVPAPYAVLKDWMPEIDVKSGGGRR